MYARFVAADQEDETCASKQENVCNSEAVLTEALTQCENFP